MLLLNYQVADKMDGSVAADILPDSSIIIVSDEWDTQRQHRKERTLNGKS